MNLDGSAILDGFLIEDGNANYNSPENNGGGMYNESSSPKLKNITFSNNYADFGGGMNNQHSSPILNNITFSNNSASSNAGGMANFHSSPTLTDVTFFNNTSGIGLGGAFADRIYSSSILINVTFSGNSAGEGGGMFSEDSTPTLTNVTFSNNSATYRGGAIINFGSLNSPTLTNVTFTGNKASQGGGMVNEYSSSATLINSILWGDTPEEIYIDADSTAFITYSDIQGGYAGTGNINVDPLLGSLQDNGGFVLTHALGYSSPAIDAGNPDPATCPATDARRLARPSDGDGDGTFVCDMGSYEYDGLPPQRFFLPLASKSP